MSYIKTNFSHSAINFLSVCKTCLIKYLEEEDACPTCHCVIHHSHALRYVKFDRTIRNIVNAIVPDLEKSKHR